MPCGSDGADVSEVILSPMPPTRLLISLPRLDAVAIAVSLRDLAVLEILLRLSTPKELALIFAPCLISFIVGLVGISATGLIGTVEPLPIPDP